MSSPNTEALPTVFQLGDVDRTAQPSVVMLSVCEKSVHGVQCQAAAQALGEVIMLDCSLLLGVLCVFKVCWPTL